MISDLKRRTVQGVGWSFLDRTLSKVLGFAVFLVMTGMLAPSDFGLAAMAKAVTALARPIVAMLIGPAVVQRAELDDWHRDSAFWMNLALGLTASVGVWLLAAPVSALLGETALTPVLAVLGLQLLFESLGLVHASQLERSLSFKPLAIRALAAEVCGGIVGLAMALGGYGVWSLVGQTLARQATASVALWVVSRWRPALRLSRRHSRELLSFGWSVMGANLVGTARSRIHELLIGAFLGATTLGYYSVAFRIIDELGNLLVGSVGSVAFPTFSRLQAEPERLTQAFLKAVEYTAALAFPAFLGLGLLAPELISATIGAQWNASAPILRGLVLLGMAGSIGRFNRSMLAASGKPAVNIALGVVDLILGAAAISITVPIGVEAVAFSYAVSSSVGFAVGLRFVLRLLRFDLRAYLRAVGPALGAAAAMAGCVVLLRAWMPLSLSEPVGLGVLVGLGAGSYVAVLFLIRPGLLRELSELGPILLPARGGRG